MTAAISSTDGCDAVVDTDVVACDIACDAGPWPRRFTDDSGRICGESMRALQWRVQGHFHKTRLTDVMTGLCDASVCMVGNITTPEALGADADAGDGDRERDRDCDGDLADAESESESLSASLLDSSSVTMLACRINCKSLILLDFWSTDDREKRDMWDSSLSDRDSKSAS
jgi:hypothetical protein